MREPFEDPAATPTLLDGNVTRLRVIGTDVIYRLPRPPWDSASLGTSDVCDFQVIDPENTVSPTHARIDRWGGTWIVNDLDSVNGLWLDGARRKQFFLEPGMEIGLGRLTLIAESREYVALRGFLARLIGFGDDRREAVDAALRAVRLGATRRLPIALCGAGDMIAVARLIHWRALGMKKRFIVCDPRRADTEATVRCALNSSAGLAAARKAVGGSLCMWTRRLPSDYYYVAPELKHPSSRVTVFVCAESRRKEKPYHIPPIMLPPLGSRAEEIIRIIEEFALDVSPQDPLAAHWCQWILADSATSISEIEKATVRLTAVRDYNYDIAKAARKIGMAPISLARWIGHRKLPGRRR